MISSGLTVQRNGQFNGYPSNRERVRITERPSDQAVNFNTSQFYPESIPLPGQVMPSQIRYQQIFGKSSTPDERNYFLTYGIAQNTLAKAKVLKKNIRGPKRERLSRQDMEMLESARDNYLTVIVHKDPEELAKELKAMEGIESNFLHPRGQTTVASSVTSRPEESVVEGSRDESMLAEERDVDITANENLAEVNDLLGNLMTAPTEAGHILARTIDAGALASPSPAYGIAPPAPPPPPASAGPSNYMENYLGRGGERSKGKGKMSTTDDITAEMKQGVKLRPSSTRVYVPAPNVLQDQITAHIAKRKNDSDVSMKSNSSMSDIR